MKANIRMRKTAAMGAALFLGVTGVALAQEADTNSTTVAYWKLGAVASVPLSPSGNGILDLATNAGQGTIPGTVSGVPVSVQDLWFQGPISSSPTFVADVPPSAMFNGNNYFKAGAGSWDCGADLFSGAGGSLTCDNITYGNEFNGPSFTFEIYFKSDTANDPVTGAQTQVLIFDHHQSAYAFLYLNDNPGDTNNIGSLRFWGWNVAVFGIDCRITAAQNHGHRLDDGHWHYAAARFNAATEMMDLLVVNDDGTSTETSSYITVPLNPGGSGSQGPLFLGCDENQNQAFDGEINQIRYSNVSLPNTSLLADAAGCSAPVFNNPATTNSVAVGDVLTLTPAAWPVQVLGGPLQYQWQLNGANVSGQTNVVLNLFPVTQAEAGTYQLVATTPCGGASAASAPMVVQVHPKVPAPIARWSFESTEGQTFGQAAVDDALPGNQVDLITFNDAPNVSGIGSNGEIALTNDVPPTTMFINGNTGGAKAFDSSYIEGVNGVVFYPNNSQGPVFDFRTAFSLELFFQSYGDQSANGPMELICQGTDGGNTFEYGINLNQAANGALSFKINNDAIPPVGPSYEDTNAGIQTVVLSDRNYADGNWHYVLAKYDSTANTISLQVANQDGTGTNQTVALPAGYSPMSAGIEGNLFMGRYRYPWSDDNRNFVGAIDEVQVTSGLVTPATGQLGYVVTPPNITGISVSGQTVTITFTGSPLAAGSAYTLLGSPTLGGTFAPLSATVSSLGGGNFQATVALSGAAEFYMIKH
jgi:hypothetical protein